MRGLRLTGLALAVGLLAVEITATVLGDRLLVHMVFLGVLGVSAIVLAAREEER
ncbi:hypothetical protein [Streptomyces griseofuscus]|uniref:hypothetical protein n=1 Tax=Streptomyces griseofuscus TaxID=146922 RepID=UPI0033DAA9E7